MVTGAVACASGDDPELASESATSEQAAVFRPGVDDLCQWFTAEEVLAIATLAYEQEGLEDSIPTELVAVTDGVEEGEGCEWTVPGTPPGWGRPDFTVSLYDATEREFADGTPIIDRVKEDIELGLHDESDEFAGGLLADGLTYVGGYGPGFDVYVESQDGVVIFRHDFAAGVDSDLENYRLEVRMLNAMMARMGWVDDDWL